MRRSFAMQPIFAGVTLRSFFHDSVGLSPTWAAALAAFLHAFILINLFAVVPLVFIWAERKVAGRIQDRLGPTRVGGRFGWLQGAADGLKLIQKEDLVPAAADGMLFRMAPYLACMAAFAAYMVLPFSDGWVAFESDIALFLLFGILSLEVLGIVLAGYSSGSKWALFGGMREAAQMVSYEIPLALAALVPVVAVGTLSLTELGRMQAGWLWNWLVFTNPFVFVAFFVYFTAATASCKRAPFDLAEAESELVAGFHTEYSGMRWSFFFMAEYAAMFLVSGVASILFLGAWHTGIGPLDAALETARANGRAADGFYAWGWLANLFGSFVFMTKGALLLCVQIWVRWTLPRLRIDQVMLTCLKYLVPITCVLFLGAVLWPLAMTRLTGRTQLLTSPFAERLHPPEAGANSGASAGGERASRELPPAVPRPASHASPLHREAASPRDAATLATLGHSPLLIGHWSFLIGHSPSGHSPQGGAP